jgi:prepilin-type N-terminal cleavage/methylation domain-containing protein
MCSERGTTLLEMLVVLSVLGMLSVLGLSLLGGRAEREADLLALRIAEQLRSVRREAMALGSALEVDTSASRPLSPDKRAIGLALVALEKLDPRDGELRFFADGSAQAGALQLRRGQTVRRLEIDWRGAVHVTP